ncbi:hypothetical protein Lal_00017691 [Lupinus albus]|uniref:Putative pectinesterase inhibitor domain-containing protein n=1 Tax=Lupinus albus TaxID=3870 RepID=A0A6A4QQN9_LUPAL|nr:putative pectinesterase inhibitor domain-containing protein [Lupinus albus]KAF1870111.1 hypothetical protein Lal_00017691 [Lupinus albus]
MEHITKLFLVLSLCVVVMAHQTLAINNVLKGKNLINNVCNLSPTRDLCVQVLSSDETSANADLRDLAVIALRVAASNASSILTDAKMLIDDANLNPEVQQGLSDCKENILDAEDQLEDTIAALLEDDDSEAQKWLKAALAAITTCDASIPGDDDVLSLKSAAFRQLCNIAIVITKSLPKFI